MNNDWELLEAYAARRDEGAFRELVRRHVDVVYGAARRMLGGPGQEAEDVTQAVFLLLARKAGGIRRNGALVGWLFRVTRYCCANVRKSEGRRRRREKEVAVREDEVERLREDLRPVLDEALAGLSEKERQAVLVRYLEGKTARETGEVLGISEEAVEKRVERGVAKLRGYFAKCGYVVPMGAVVVVLCAEAKSAPAGLAGNIGTSAGVSRTAAAIAKGVTAMMRRTTMKMVATALVVAVILPAGGMIATNAVVHGHTEMDGVVGMEAGERVMFVRWDEVVRDRGAARVIAAGAVKPTTSVGYTVIEADAGKVRAALKDAAGRGELLAMTFNEPLGWASLNEWTSPTEQIDFGIFSHVLNNFVHLDDPRSVSVLAGEAVRAFLEARGGLVRVRLPGEMSETRLDGGDGLVTKKLMMAYAGDVPVGRAVVFIGDLGNESGAELYHLSVWEAFSCSEAEWPYVHRAELAEWRDGGVGPLKKRADRVLAWEATGPSVEKVGAAWQRRLTNGAVVRVLAVCDMNKWPECWWDAEGNPVQAPKEWLWNLEAANPGEDVRVAVGIEDPTAVVAADAGFAMEGNVMGDSRSAVSIVKLADGALEAGIGAGPWKGAGELRLGQKVEAGGITAVAEKLEQASPKAANWAGSTLVHGQIVESPDREGEVVAFDKTGKAAKALGLPSMVTDRAELQREKMTPMTSIIYLDASDIGKMELRVRQRSWVRFEGIAMKPRIEPGTVRAAVIDKPAVPAAATELADRATPGGVMRMFMAAIKSQDAAGARKLMMATTAEEQEIADAMVSNLMGNVALRDAAVKRFGESETNEALVRPGLCDEMAGVPDGEWKIDGETARFEAKQRNVVMTGGPGSTLIRLKGKWFMDMALPKAMDEELRKSLPRYVAMQKEMGALDVEVAKGIAAGKYKDAYEVKDALLDGLRAAKLKDAP